MRPAARFDARRCFIYGLQGASNFETDIGLNIISMSLSLSRAGTLLYGYRRLFLKRFPNLAA
jgi:hypothetical protein